jgi:hypothetical protein
MKNYIIDISKIEDRSWDNFPDFTKSHTTDIVADIQNNNVKPEDVYVEFKYTAEGTTWLINDKWFMHAIHDFANSINIPLKNITYTGTNAKLDTVYNKWHSIYAPEQDKINLQNFSFGIKLYQGRFYRENEVLYIPNKINKNLRTKKFNCLNANMLEHRILFLKEMYNQNVLDLENNLISFHWFKNLNQHAEAPQELKDMCPIQFDLVGDWEQVYSKIFEKDMHNTDWNKTGNFSYIYDDTYFTVTTESSECYTLANYHRDDHINEYMKEFHEEMFLTEKIFRPILYWHPQLVQCSTGTLDYLKQLGFKTFSNYWNEDYDNEPNGERRTQMIVSEVKKLNNKSLEELHEMYWDMMPILEHNRNLLLDHDFIRSPWYKTSRS